MTMILRMVNLLKAEFHGIMELIEDRGLLLKQHLRDMEDALDQEERRWRRKLAFRRQTQKQQDIFKLDQEMVQLKDCLNRRRIQYEQIKHRSIAYFEKIERQDWEKRISGYNANDIDSDMKTEKGELELLQRKELMKGDGES